MKKPVLSYMKIKVQISCEVYDQRLCFRYIDSTIPLLSKFLSLYLSSVSVQPVFFV